MEHLDRLEAKVDKILDEQSRMNSTLARQNATLEEHVRRTSLLEKAQEEIRAEMKPLTRAHYFWAGLAKGVAVLGATFAMVLGFLKLLSYFRV